VSIYFQDPSSTQNGGLNHDDEADDDETCITELRFVPADKTARKFSSIFLIFYNNANKNG